MKKHILSINLLMDVHEIRYLLLLLCVVIIFFLKYSFRIITRPDLRNKSTSVWAIWIPFFVPFYLVQPFGSCKLFSTISTCFIHLLYSVENG